MREASGGEQGSIELSDSLDAESAAIEAEFGSGAEEGEGLDALEPDLEELRGAAPERKKASAYDENHTRVAVLAHMAIISGPDAGKNVSFIGIRMVLGRAPDLEISLTDLAVSRRHAEFIRGDSGVLLRDLGSGNGTQVNGKRVTEQMLSHNDVVTVGSTQLRYINESEAPPVPESTSLKKPEPALKPESQLALVEKKAPDGGVVAEKALAREEAPGAVMKRSEARLASRRGQKSLALPEGVQKRKRKILLAAGCGAVLCVVLVLALGRGEGAKEVAGGLELAPPPPTAESYMSQMREAVRRGEYEQALELLGLAKAIEPGIDTGNAGAQIELERDVHNKLREVEGMLTREEFGAAKVAIDAIPDASARLNEEKKKLLERLTTEERQAHLRRAEELLMFGEFDAAAKALSVLPRAQQEGIGEKIVVGRDAYQEAKRLEREAIRIAGARGTAARKTTRQQQIARAFTEVQRKFNGEDWRRAADECDRVVEAHPKDAEIVKLAKARQKQILEFGAAYDEGAKKHRAGQIAGSATPLAKARALYGKIQFDSVVGGKLDKMLSEAALLAGEDSLARGDFAAAAKHFREAQKLAPSSPRAQQGMRRVVEKAEDLFGMGYSLRSINPREAAQYFRLIIEITRPGTDWHEKAKNQLATMSH